MVVYSRKIRYKLLRQICCMEANCTYLPYSQTNYFSNIAIDYINNEPQLQPFYKHQVNTQGILDAIKERQKFSQQRKTLVDELQKQYEGINQFARLKRIYCCCFSKILLQLLPRINPIFLQARYILFIRSFM